MTCRMAASRMTHMSAWATRRRVVPYTRAVTRGKTFITAQHSPRSSKSTNLWCEWVLITIRQQAGILFLKIKVWASPHPQSLTALLNVLNSADLSACSFLWFFNSRECPCYGKLTWGPRSKKYTSHSLSDLHCEKQLINYTLKRHTRWGGGEYERSIPLETTKCEMWGNTDSHKQEPAWKTPRKLPRPRERRTWGITVSGRLPHSLAFRPLSLCPVMGLLLHLALSFPALCQFHALSISGFITLSFLSSPHDKDLLLTPLLPPNTDHSLGSSSLVLTPRPHPLFTCSFLSILLLKRIFYNLFRCPIG